MTTECGVKTVTVVVNGETEITTQYSAGKNDKPIIFRADLLDDVRTINNVSGQEGELVFTHIDSGENVAKITDDGELIISTENDDNEKYSVNDLGELIYTE